MKNLLFVIKRYFPYGGMQRTFLRIVQKCLHAGFQVTVLCEEWDGEVPSGLILEKTPLKARTNHGKLAALAIARDRYLISNHCDCVIGFAKIPGLDIYYEANPCFKEQFEQTKPFWFRYLPRYKALLENEAAVFGPESKTQSLVISPRQVANYEFHYQTPSARLKLLPPGINKERLAAPHPVLVEGLNEKYGLRSSDKILLTLGSSFKTKGIDRLIYAIASLPELLRTTVKALVVGEGQPAKFIALAKQLGISQQVIFTGPTEIISPLYVRADWLVHPARTENTGTTLLEALCCGVPVIATGTCGFAEHIEQASAGFICPEPFVQNDLNQILLQALTAPATQLQFWREAGLAYAGSHDITGLIDSAVQHIKVWSVEQERESVS